MPPRVLVSDFIGRLKGGSAHDVNQQFARREKIIQWQAGYGIVTFGTRDLDWVTAYVRNQREHHARGTIHERLERVTELPRDESAQAPQREAP